MKWCILSAKTPEDGMELQHSRVISPKPARLRSERGCKHIAFGPEILASQPSCRTIIAITRIPQ